MNGNDANPCSLTLPCRGFAAALLQTSPAGEIIALDTAGYGPLTINKAVTIEAPSGIHAVITAMPGQDAVTVNTPGNYVVLRGLEITGGPSFGLSGINFQAGLGLTVENCVISYMANNGIAIAATDSRVAIIGTTLRLNGQAALAVQGSTNVSVARSALIQNNAGGISVFAGPAISPLFLSIEDSVLTGNGSFGISVNAPFPVSSAIVSVSGSTIAGSGMGGVSANSVFGSTALVTATGNSVVQNAGPGFVQVGSAKIVLSRNVISSNMGYGVTVDLGGTVLSAGDNLINDNAAGSANVALGYSPLQ